MPLLIRIRLSGIIMNGIWFVVFLSLVTVVCELCESSVGLAWLHTRMDGAVWVFFSASVSSEGDMCFASVFSLRARAVWWSWWLRFDSGTFRPW